VLASLEDPSLPPIDQNCATFFNRYAIDDEYGGLAFEEEADTLLPAPVRPVEEGADHGQSRHHGHRRYGR
jgi:hypothetical protein